MKVYYIHARLPVYHVYACFVLLCSCVELHIYLFSFVFTILIICWLHLIWIVICYFTEIRITSNKYCCHLDWFLLFCFLVFLTYKPQCMYRCSGDQLSRCLSVLKTHLLSVSLKVNKINVNNNLLLSFVFILFFTLFSFIYLLLAIFRITALGSLSWRCISRVYALFYKNSPYNIFMKISN